MHKLTQINCVPADEMTFIVQSKQGDNRAALDAALPRIRRRYALFEQRFTIDELASVTAATWSDEEEKALLHCYNAEVAQLTELKRLIRDEQPKSLRTICPYCGIGAPVQFDHYLPKMKFPELAVHAYNLVPCCGPCNGKKGETWLLNGARAFINFYIDSLPTSPILDANLTWRTYRGELIPKVAFVLVRPARFNVARFALIEKHFEKLELLRRYQEQAHTEFDDFRDNACAREATTVRQLRTFLQNYINRRTQRLGPLHWRLALYRSMVADTPFLQSCLA